MSFFDELKRRNVFKVAAAYLLVGWLIMQISDVMVPTLRLPEWVQTATAYFLIIGFLPAIVFAWAFELTPEGLRRETSVADDEAPAHAGGQKLNYVIIGALVIVIAVLLIDRGRAPDSLPEPATQPVATTVEADAPKSVAVLPFSNLSADEENAFFAAGVHEDILTHLSRVSDLHVNSRTSVMQYARTELNMKDVARELGARYILEGSVRRSGNRVRVTAQLIDAENDVHLWADNFDRDLTDIFAIQTAVAREITEALQAELSPVEQNLISGRPTDSIEAYDLFLQARLAIQDTENQSLFDGTAVQLLEQAVAADPDYAQAWALLAVAHGELYWFRIDPDPARLERMKQAVDRAFELQPDLPEARLALAAYYYRGSYDYQKALEQLELVRSVLPNDPLVLYNLGLTQRRLGLYGQTIESLLRVTEIDPAHQAAWAEAAGTASSSNRHQRALAIAQELKARFPDKARMVAERAVIRVKLFGDVQGARDILESLPEANHFYYWQGWQLTAQFGRDYQKLAEVLLKENYIESFIPGGGKLEAARYLSLGGFTSESQKLLEEAGGVLGAGVNEPYAQNFAWPHASYAMYLVMDGRPTEAEQSCRRSESILSVETDKVHGPQLAVYCAWVRGMAGDTERALDTLEQLLDLGWDMNYWFLSLSPEWDFLRDEERFERLVERARIEMEAMLPQ